MPKPTKRNAKALPAATIPEPFSPAPAGLYPLLSTFDQDKVYISHIDSHPAWFKKRVFFVPVLLNIVIAVLLILRAWYAYPWYWDITMSFLGNENKSTVHWAKSDWRGLVWGIGGRGLTFLFDFLLFRIVGPWPKSFFLDVPGNPVWWRIKIGFRDEEVYVRESRGWGAKDLLGEAEGSTGRAGAESPFFKTRILPAVDTRRLREKTGYMLMDKDYDLDFWGMIKATELVDKRTMSLDMLRKSVFVWVGTDEKGQWAVWDCWRLDEGSETDARQKIILFKDKLTAMGKENLFFKWVELVQFESSAPGEFTQERQIATANKAKKLFQEQGVDFDTFINDIGGLEGMPGID